MVIQCCITMTFLLVIVLKHVFGSAGRNGMVGQGGKGAP